jgi:hypothetical protein
MASTLTAGLEHCISLQSVCWRLRSAAEAVTHLTPQPDYIFEMIGASFSHLIN